MKIMKLTLQNFKGIRSFEADFEGQDATIYGTNATGKTTIADAVSWLLFDKPSTDEKGFNPKPRDKMGEDIHNLDTVVRGSFSTEEGTILLEKRFSEIWTKKRGATESEFTGHTTEYKIDDVPVQKNLYEQRIDLLVPQELRQILIHPTYFSEGLSWQKRRELLLRVCGDITDEEVLKQAGMTELLEQLRKPDSESLYSVEEYRSIVKARGKKLNEELKEIPARIDEAQKSLSGTDADQKEYLLCKERSYQKSLEERKEKLAEIKASGPEMEIKQQIQAAKLKQMEKKNEYLRRFNEQNQEMNQKREAVIREENALTGEIRNLARKRQELIESLDRARSKRDHLIEELKAARAMKYTGDDICPTCGQVMPAEKREEALARFNEQKSIAIEKIKREAEESCSKDIIRRMEEELMKAKTSEEELRQRLEEVARKDDAAHVIYMQPYEETEGYKQLQEQIEELEHSLMNAEHALNTGVDKLRRGITADQDELFRISQTLYAIENDERQRKRIESLREDLKGCGSEYEKAMRGLDLCEDFIKAKISMLDQSINGKFKTVSFQLFENQINGGIKDCCKVLVPGPAGTVRYESANHAARINAGLEIIDTLAEHFGYSLPVFVDNAESVVSLTPVHAQVIRLVVSESDSELRVEIKEE